MNWLTQVTALPTDVLKATGAIVGGLILAAFTYVIGRLKEPKAKPPEQGARVALSPEDRDLAFTLVRTGTDLTRALTTHGEILGKLVKPAPMPRTRRRVTPH
ncbi:hypothetical protein OKC48_07525 [Methylorubrum extorquens]|uniref:hypothetical protein n=1 Tax=Methylorubrum extorquens TaxID=408 RepID=UPI0022385ADD|nr:hypothetical protein [Methylorubrum extorquens]UYW28356.1 hypothetical protein OKC48_07525 [Methylorubrum extorquens]